MAEEKNIENGIKKWLKDNHFYHFWGKIKKEKEINLDYSNKLTLQMELDYNRFWCFGQTVEMYGKRNPFVTHKKEYEIIQ